jgi:hypothetical protein
VAFARAGLADDHRVDPLGDEFDQIRAWFNDRVY